MNDDAITRRHALRVLGAACALPCLEACVTQRSYQARADGDVIRVPGDQLAHLRGPVDSLTVRAERVPPILVRRLDGERFVAVDSRCPHSGCSVRAEPDGFVCPCHGSAFGTLGDLLDGPAQTPLRRYSTTRDGDALLIHLS